jgi:valyl-tRNA synthetase
VRPGPFDRWILGRLDAAARDVTRHLESRRFNEACQALYHFVWNDICDWYVELSKPLLYGSGDSQAATHATMRHVLSDAVKLLHPVMPFVTEELWQALGNGELVMIQPYPGPSAAASAVLDEATRSEVGTVIEVIEVVRNLRGELGVKPKQRVSIVMKCPPAVSDPIQRDAGYRAEIATLAGVSAIAFDPRHTKRGDEVHGVGNGFEIFLDRSGLMDVGQERERLTREIGKLKPQVDKLHAKLANPGFVDKAPAPVVEKNRAELAGLQAQLDKLSQSLTQLEA